MFRVSCCVLLLAVAFFAETTADAESLEKCHDPNTVMGCKPDYCGDVCFQAPHLKFLCPRGDTCESGGCHCAPGFNYDPNPSVQKCVPVQECSNPVPVPLDT